jgi:hypothetical protein
LGVGIDDDRDRWIVKVASSCMYPISSVDGESRLRRRFSIGHTTLYRSTRIWETISRAKTPDAGLVAVKEFMGTQ